MKKILIIRLSSLGDIVLTEPIIRELRKTFPNAILDYLTKPTYKDLIGFFNQINNIHLWHEKKMVLKKLKEQKYDIVIDLHSKFNTFIIKKYLHAPIILSYKKLHFHRWLLTKHISKKPIKSTVSLYFSALRKLGIKENLEYPKLYISQRKQNFDDWKGKKIGIFPGALHITKQYPIEKFAEIINQTPDDWNCKYYILGTKNEIKLAKHLISLTNIKVQNLCGNFTIKELVIALDEMDLVITNDSGPMHISAALRKPQIAIFGATHPILGFAPLNKEAKILSTNIDCQPCSLHGSKKCKKRN